MLLPGNLQRPIRSLSPITQALDPGGFRYLGVGVLDRDCRYHKISHTTGAFLPWSISRNQLGFMKRARSSEPTNGLPHHESLGCGKSLFPLE